MSHCSAKNHNHSNGHACACNSTTGTLAPIPTPDTQNCASSSAGPTAPCGTTEEEEQHGCGCSSCGCHDHSHEHGSGDERRELVIMGISAVLFGIGMVADEAMARYVPNWLVIAVFYALPYFLCGYDVLHLGLRSNSILL